jgi:hypothetical protein
MTDGSVVRPTVVEVKFIREDVSEIKNLLRTLYLNKNNNNKSPQRKLACFKCGKEGHFPRDSHLREPFQVQFERSIAK